MDEDHAERAAQQLVIRNADAQTVRFDAFVMADVRNW
jgi:hypothetical protein